MDQQHAHFASFTERAKAALVVAQREAQRREQAFIEPEHLLLGMLCEPQNTAWWTLQKLGVVPEMVRATIEAHLLSPVSTRTTLEAGLTDEQMAIETVLPLEQSTQVVMEDTPPLALSGAETTIVPQLSPRAKQVITFAVAEFTNLHHPVLATGHFPLGILREKQGSAFFTSWGIDLKTARTKMKRLSRQALLAEQQPSPLSSLVEAVNEISASSSGQPIGAVKIDIAQQQRILAHRRNVRKTMWIYAAVFAVIAFAVNEFALHSPQIIAAYHIGTARLASTPGLAWQPVVGWRPLLVLLIYLVINSVLLAIALPLHWYISTVIPSRNGFTQRTTRQWVQMVASKSLFLMYLAVCLLVELVTWLMVVQPRSWWAWAALAPTLFFVVMGFFGSSRFAFWAKNITPLNEGEVFTRFQSLRQRLQIPACGLYQFQVSHRSKVANAFFAGWGPGRRVVLTDTLLQQFPPEEIEVIIAHELGHCVHSDIWTNIAMSGLLSMGVFGLIQLYINMFVVMANTNALSALLQPLYLLIGILLFLGLLRLNLLYRRYKEYRADEFALRAIKDVQIFKDSMTRLTSLSMPRWRIRRASTATHPTLVKRLRHADEFAQRQRTAATSSQI